MATALELIADPSLGIDPITATTSTANKKGYTHSELAHFHIGDEDIKSLILQIYAFGTKKKPTENHNFRWHISDAVFEDSIDKTPTFTLTLHDPDWDLLNTGALNRTIDINPGNLPKRWYRLDSYSVVDNDITLVFAVRNAVYLTYHKRPRKANRKKTTRAEFILSLLRDVEKVKIPYYSPELHKRQKVEKYPSDAERKKNRDKGFTASDKITVKNSPANGHQRNVIEQVIQAGIDVNAPGLLIVSAVMTIIQETAAGNKTTGNPPYIGVFQQNPKDGWPATGNAYKDAIGNRKVGQKQGGYYGWAQALWNQLGGNVDLGLFVAKAQGVVGSTNPLNSGYAMETNKWRSESQHAVNAFGGIDIDDPGSPATSTFKKKYEFMVGPPDGDEDENYLAAIYRLADDVQWAAFWVKDELHFQDQKQLFKSKPQASLRRFHNGVETVSFEWDGQQKLNQMTIGVRMKRWICPIGTVVHFEEGGPAEGRWLVTNIRRSMFDELGEIILSKPMRKKLEPANEPGTRTTRDGQPTDITDPGVGPQGGQMIDSPAGFPVPNPTSVGGVHDTSGLPGYPARDYFAPAGSACVSPVDGKVDRLSGHDPKDGAYAGAGGPLGWSVYITASDTGWSYYLTHMGSLLCFKGQTVKQGEVIGTVANYHSYGRPDHIHMGVHGHLATTPYFGPHAGHQFPTP